MIGLQQSPSLRAGIVVMLLIVASTAPLHAQASKAAADSARVAQATAVRSSAVRIQSPAAFALEHTIDLLLSPQQTTQLQRLAAAQSDSVVVRRNRAVAAMQVFQMNANSPTAKALQSWEGTVDELAIRAEACRQSEVQADAMIGLAKDRHTVGAVLSPGQQRTMDRLFTAALTPGR